MPTLLLGKIHGSRENVTDSPGIFQSLSLSSLSAEGNSNVLILGDDIQNRTLLPKLLKPDITNLREPKSPLPDSRFSKYIPPGKKKGFTSYPKIHICGTPDFLNNCTLRTIDPLVDFRLFGRLTKFHIADENFKLCLANRQQRFPTGHHRWKDIENLFEFRMLENLYGWQRSLVITPTKLQQFVGQHPSLLNNFGLLVICREL